MVPVTLPPGAQTAQASVQNQGKHGHRFILLSGKYATYSNAKYVTPSDLFLQFNTSSEDEMITDIKD